MPQVVATCGTGGWTGPKPGDPDNNVLLSANTTYGGINVSWSFPTINPYAVAHVQLYRGVVNDFSMATLRGIVSGSFFFDALNPIAPTAYFYWIKIVSVNGTVGDVIGPASAVAVPRSDQTMEDLTGRIDAGVLAMSLKTTIGNITLLGQGLSEETTSRINANAALSTALAAVQLESGQATTYLLNETSARTTADTAIVSSVNVMAASVNGNTAAIVTESNVRAAADTAAAGSLSLLTVRVDNAAAAVLTESNTRAAADSALASSINTVQSNLNYNLASVQTTLQTNINTVDGKVTDIGALYTAKVTVNGLIGGFGIYNNGYEVQAGFDVDTFWVGRTSADKVKPFIISGGIVYIDKTRIKNADIDTLKIAGNAVIIPVGDFVVDTTTTTLNTTVVVSGLNAGEYVPLHVHYGIVVGTGVYWDQTLNGAVMGSGDYSAGGALSYIGTQYWVTNGTYTVGMTLRTNPTGSRRLSILAQVIKR